MTAEEQVYDLVARMREDFAKVRADVARMESKIDGVLSLVDLIENPIVRKMIKSRITK